MKKALPAIVLLGGIMLGGIGTSLVPHAYPAKFFASLVALDNDDPGPTPAEHVLFEEHVGTTTAHTALRAKWGTNTEATATSSPRSFRVPVMIYHSVRPHILNESREQDAYDVAPELLEQELLYIKDHGFTPVTFADVVAYFDLGTPLPPKPVILSFDDGWKNEYTYAFPLLKKFGMKGTFFIFTNPIDREKKHWMTWNEVKELDHAGMEIGGHTRTHPVLTAIVTDAGLDREILGGKKIIEAEVGHQITTFAYPFGATDARVIARVKHAGYLLARTTNWGVWNDPEHRFEFHGTLSTDNIADFEKALNRE